MSDKVNPAEKFELFSEQWSPRIIGQVNDHQVKLVKIKGEFVWHRHEDQDEMFWLAEGRLAIKFRNKDVWLEPGEFIIVPRGVEHMPFAPEEAQIILFEPEQTVNTGDGQPGERTREPKWL